MTETGSSGVAPNRESFFHLPQSEIERRNLLLWSLTILYCLAIFFFSSLEGDDLGNTGPKVHGFDKLQHIGLYFGLGYLVYLAFRDSARLQPRLEEFLESMGASFYRLFRNKNMPPGMRLPCGLLVVTVLFCYLYGFSDEVHQSFVDGRSASVADLFVDGVGGLLAALFLNLHFRKRILDAKPQERKTPTP